jgi:hypothetical protein
MVGEMSLRNGLAPDVASPRHQPEMLQDLVAPIVRLHTVDAKVFGRSYLASMARLCDWYHQLKLRRLRVVHGAPPINRVQDLPARDP